MEITYSNGLNTLTINNDGQEMFNVKVTGTDKSVVSKIERSLNEMTFLRNVATGLPDEMLYKDEKGFNHIFTASDYYMENKMDGLALIFGYMRLQG